MKTGKLFQWARAEDIEIANTGMNEMKKVTEMFFTHHIYSPLFFVQKHHSITCPATDSLRALAINVLVHNLRP